ncbi:MAG: hypothetical protein EP343_26645 [Deltaproteobacteria bacterium]|nr:MAG: hypothetical protein EP343_26645 [Deltaproteobacteria bacterium]
MRTGYKVMAYRLKKHDDKATIDSFLVEDRHVDDSGELDLLLEDDCTTGQIRRHTGVFHPNVGEPQPLNQTGVFHPQIVDGVAYIPPAEDVSISQIIESRDISRRPDAMAIIDDVLVAVAKTEEHEVSFVDNEFVDPTRPSVLRVEEPSHLPPHNRHRAVVAPQPEWLDSPANDDIHPGGTLVLRSTQRPVVIPEVASKEKTTEHLRAWAQSGTSSTIVALKGVEEIPTSPNIVAAPASPKPSTSAAKSMAAVKEATPQIEEPALVMDDELDWRPPSSLQANTVQKLTLVLLGALVVVELLRLLMGS